MNNLQFIGCLIFKEGSNIHIKKKNEGKFTESAKRAGESVQEHAKNVLNNPHSTTLLKKRAQFAVNAKKWKAYDGIKVPMLNIDTAVQDAIVSPQLQSYIANKETLQLLSHLNRETGDVSPFYDASSDTYGTVPLRLVSVAAPMTWDASRKAEGRRGGNYMREAISDYAFPVGSAIMDFATLTMPMGGGSIRQTASALEDGVIRLGSKYKPTRNLALSRALSKELNAATKVYDGTVGPGYFRDPTKFYRVTLYPEVANLRELGMNVTTRDLANYPSAVTDWRNSVLKNRNIRLGLNGYELIPTGERKPTLIKFGSAHGNTTQAAIGKPWEWSFANNSRFTDYMLEGDAPTYINARVDGNRSIYASTLSSDLPAGYGIGFETGTMPMENLRAFKKLPNGRYLDEGVVVPNKRIYTEGPLSAIPYGQSMKLYERPSTLTESERLGLPRGERNQVVKSETYLSHPDRKIPNELPAHSEWSDKFADIDLLNDKELSDNWINYINNLSDDPISNKALIEDYKLYLSNLGYVPYLSDTQIAKLISNQYNQLVSGQTGKLKGTVMFHGSPEMFDTFDLAKTGSYTGNMGAVGPGNYFSTQRNPYGLHYNQRYYGEYSGNMQPYLINGVKSTPEGDILRDKKLIPPYVSTGLETSRLNELKASRRRAILNGEDTSVIDAKLKEAQNNPYIKEYNAFIQKLINDWKLNKDAFIIDSHSWNHPTVTPMKNGKPIYGIEGMIHRNTGIKSLFPHPSTLMKDDSGNWIIKRDWNDPRVNYKNGGKI